MKLLLIIWIILGIMTIITLLIKRNYLETLSYFFCWISLLIALQYCLIADSIIENYESSNNVVENYGPSNNINVATLDDSKIIHYFSLNGVSAYSAKGMTAKDFYDLLKSYR